jgi:Thioredoxin-like domain
MIASSPTITIPWLTSWDEARVASRKTRRPILTDVYQDDCGGCDKLDEETFGDTMVAREIVSRFVPLKLHLMKDREFTREHQVFWTPTVLFADHSGRIRYTSPNFLPSAEFLDLMDIAEANIDMRWMRYQMAINRLQDMIDRSPSGPLTAEAIYWRGISAYFRDKKSSKSANQEWAELLERFPDSIWAKRIP